MSTIDIAFLGLVILGFGGFGIVLAAASWYERSGADRNAAAESGHDRHDSDIRRAA